MSISLGNERLLQLAEILETADALHAERGEPAYNQKEYAHRCGTPACALGHWAAANPDSWEISSYEILPRGDFSRFQQAHNEFVLQGNDYEELFGLYGCNRAKTAKEAAAYIRAFVARRQS